MFSSSFDWNSISHMYGLNSPKGPDYLMISALCRNMRGGVGWGGVGGCVGGGDAIFYGLHTNKT